MMEGWTDRLHSQFLGEHVLVTQLRLTSFGTFFVAALVTFAICAVESALTIALARHWMPFRESPGAAGRAQVVLWRTALHWISILLSLLYMLIAMSFHVGLILVIITTLAAGKGVLEYLNQQSGPSHSRQGYRISPSTEEPLLSLEERSAISLDKMETRSRGRPKPSNINIHPTQSNLARADAAAVELGLHGSTALVSATMAPKREPWDSEKGRSVTREIMGSSRSGTHHRTPSQTRLFRVEDESDGEDDT